MTKEELTLEVTRFRFERNHNYDLMALFGHLEPELQSKGTGKE